MIKQLTVALAAVVVGLLGTVTAPAAAAVDVFITPGTHTVNGRQWKTECSSYSATVDRCRTDIWATVVVWTGKAYVQKTDWHFNNLTYKASPRATWVSNNLGRNAEWEVAGRKWKTECDTPGTGRNNCRSWIWATYTQAVKVGTTWTYKNVQGWLYNNNVRFSDDTYLTVSGTGDQTITLPAGVTELYVKLSHTALATPDPEEGDGFAFAGPVDADGEGTDGLLACFGTCTTADAFGYFGAPAATIEVVAVGDWTIVVKPLSAAPRLTTPFSGSNSEVMWHWGGQASPTLTAPDSEFTLVIDQNPANDDDYVTVVEQEGNYTGPMPLTAGPRLVWVIADGNWTIS